MDRARREREDRRLLDLAVECGFDRSVAANCLARLLDLYGTCALPIPSLCLYIPSLITGSLLLLRSIHMVPSSGAGEDGVVFVTVEKIGDDFLASLADATQPVDDWDDLKGIETEACGNLNDMMMKNVPNRSRAPDGLDAFDFPSDDLDFDMGDGIDNLCNNSSGIQRQAQSRNSGMQSRSSTKSTVRHLS
ncbi:hypothetical protein HU200_009604 [Digitaria exilis]|uniref:Uncharacterized protein n=1 Tax=Digitaria exilis TaxID=1010633 RepID=A0A835KQP6_9POAL|nr:hypothetical protein HU200_009604 [Digitaria exilis]